MKVLITFLFFFLLSFSIVTNAQTLSFTEVAQQLGVSHVDYAAEASWGDFDNDGDIDLYATSYGYAITGPNLLNSLFRNDVNISGVFVDVAQQMGVEEALPASWGSTWCDFDADGKLDLYVCTNSYSYPAYTKLFINKNNFFEDRADSFRVNNWGRNLMNSWGDYDNDGDQDLYVCVSNYPGKINKLFRNDGPYFTDVTAVYNIVGGKNSNSAHWVDFDNDGDLDLYVSNAAFEDSFYENRIDENNTFVSVLNFYNLADSSLTDGTVWFDYDNDHDLDLLLVNMKDVNFPHLYSGSQLYKNEIPENNGFVNVSDQVGFGDTFSASGCTIADYDLDGDLDIYATVRPGKNKYFRNDINVTGLFSEIGGSLNIADTLNSQSAISGDYDNDGDMDIFVVNFAREDCRLYQNNLNLDYYLKIRLLDANGNYNRFSSRVKVYRANTDSLLGMQAVDGGGSGGRVQNAYDCHFGLNPNLAYDIEVMFTTRTNGQNHIFNKYNRPELGGVVPSQIGHFLEVRDSVVTVTGLKAGQKPQFIEEFRLYQNYPNPFNSSTTIPFQVDQRTKVKVAIYDLSGKKVCEIVNKNYSHGFYEIKWDGKNQEGGDVASGMYICNFLLDNKLQDVRKMFLIR